MNSGLFLISIFVWTPASKNFESGLAGFHKAMREGSFPHEERVPPRFPVNLGGVDKLMRLDVRFGMLPQKAGDQFGQQVLANRLRGAPASRPA